MSFIHVLFIFDGVTIVVIVPMINVKCCFTRCRERKSTHELK